MKKRILMLSLLLCLTACGGQAGDGPDTTETLSGKVHVPEFASAEAEAGYILQACVSEGTVWLTGAVSQEAEMEDGNGTKFFTPISGTALFQGGSSGGSFRQTEGYRSFDFLNGAAGYVSTLDCWPGREGSVWLVTSAVPWDGQPSGNYVQQFDTNGTELTRFSLDELPGNLPLDWISGVITDEEDRLYLHLEDSVAVFDREQKLLCTLDAANAVQRDAMVLLEDGRAALRTAGASPGEAGALRAIRPESGGWGESYPLPVRCGEVWSGGGGYLFFCGSGDALYGYRAETGELVRLLSWTGVDINSGRVLCLSALEEGRLVAVASTDSGAEIAVLTPADPDSLPEAAVLTYATLDLRSDVRAEIVEFNKARPACRIEVRDYSEYNTAGDMSAGITRLHTEMLAGNIPDLLDTSGLPILEYGQRGYLEDLIPYIENDPDLGRDALMERVVDAACRDGKLYQAFPSFTILTAAGRPDLVGERMSWTWEDFQDALAALPEGSTAFGSMARDELLELLLPMTLDGLVDREAGAVHEDAVRALLEFCGTVPVQAEDPEDIYAGTLAGRQLLLPAELATLNWEAVLYPAAFGGACSYVGYPRDGGVGSSFRLQDGAAMTTACKDKEAAWSFLRKLFLPRYPTGTYFGTAFPISRADFERMAEQATGPLLDELGQPVEGGVTGWVIMPDSSLEVSVRPLTQEEFDQFMALYQAVDQVYGPDEDLTVIIREEAGAYFVGGKSLEEAVRLIVSRAGLYLSENQ